MTLDANIIVAYLNGESAVVDQIIKWRREGVTLLLPTVVEAEILSFPALVGVELQKTEVFLTDNFTSIPLDRAIARVAASIRRTYKMKLPDAAIAATALMTHTSLVTRNAKDFRKVHGIRMLTI